MTRGEPVVHLTGLAAAVERIAPRRRPWSHPAPERAHVHYFIWVCTNDNRMVQRCACGARP